MRSGSHILVVEDNPADQLLLREGLAEPGSSLTVHIVEDGEKALQFLNRIGPYQEAPTPDLVLLDLNLPRKDGREVLQEVKAHPTLRRIPVVILTSSEAERDVNMAYEGYANSYFSKSPDLEEFLGTLGEIKKYWLSLVRLPHRSPRHRDARSSHTSI
jgi:two-component system, chemotaxis family, response regulator Rcp1